MKSTSQQATLFGLFGGRPTLWPVFTYLVLHTSAWAQSPSLVSMGPGGLIYTPFAMEGQTNAVNLIPDFSYAGYMRGGVSLPELPVVVSLSPSSNDDTPAIQAAIDMVEALAPDSNGFRGAILLTAGCYQVDQLFIEESGVVLRGEGQGMDGTVLYAKLLTRHDFISLQGSGSGLPRIAASRQPITSAYVPVGTHTFDVADASGFAVGDSIVVVRTPNWTWINELGMDATSLCGNDPNCSGWTPNSYAINHERIITSISGNTIGVDLPIVDVMETQYGGGEIYKINVTGRISHSGVEHLRIISAYDTTNVQDEDHAWIGIRMKRAVNCWVKNVTGQHLGYGTVTISNESNFNTVQECATLDPVSEITGGRRYSFNISDGIGNLFQRNYTRGGRHDLVTGSRVTGPNVFLDNYCAETHSDIGPHHRWATGLLFDNSYGGQMRVQNRGSSGSGHGWAGNTTLFWNLWSEAENVKVESPRGGKNWGIGCRGLTQNGAGHWESWGATVAPRSLYLQQLEDRLGTAAVNNIAIPQQLTGNIFDLLAAWAGEGDSLAPFHTRTLFVAEDAHVRAGSNANNNYGSASELQAKENSGTNHNNDRMAFLKFDLSGISGPIYRARLRLNVTNSPPGAAQNSLHFVAQDVWSEATITWNNQPPTTALLATKVVPLVNGQWMEYDVTSIANSEMAGDGTLSFRLSESTMNNLYAFASKEGGGTGFAPQIVYELDPNPPTLGCGNTVLSGHWDYFTARKEGGEARLDWNAFSDLEADFYGIGWGTDGQNFMEIGPRIQPDQASTTGFHYTHKNPVTGMNYYRIRQVDMAGNTSYSPTQRLFFQSTDLSPHVAVYPNPTTEAIHIACSENDQIRRIDLFSLVGERIKTLENLNGNQHCSLDLSDLPTGVYILKVGPHVQRIIKAESAK